MSRLINTNRKADLKKFVQSLVLINYKQLVDTKDITLLEFGGTSVLIDYLLFEIGNVQYTFQNNKLGIRLVKEV